MTRQAWVCVHDHTGGAASHAARCRGAVRATPNITHVPAEVLPAGTLVEGGPYPGIGRRDMALAAGVRAHDRAQCPAPECRAAEGRASRQALEAFETARDLRAHLAGGGVDGHAADMIVKATAPARHERRAEWAYTAALAWAADYYGPTPRDPERAREIEAGAWLACVLDAHGVGGPFDAGGLGGDRHPAFREIAARRGTAAGDAWCAAIDAAAQRLRAELGSPCVHLVPATSHQWRGSDGKWHLSDDGDPWVISTVRLSSPALNVQIQAREEQARWLRALALRELLAGLGLATPARAGWWCTCGCVSAGALALFANAAQAAIEGAEG